MESLKQRLSEMEHGRFRDLIETLRVDGCCERCSSFNPHATDAYKCKVSGSCIAATLHPDLQSYMWWKLGWITQEQHMANLGI